MSVKVLIVDDHNLFRQGLKRLLDDMPDIDSVVEAASASEAMEKVEDPDIGVMLLDISMPGRGGLDVLADVRKVRPALPVLILTMHPEEKYALRVLKAGASGYLTKMNASEEIEKAIKEVMSGRKYISSELAERLVFNFLGDSDKPPHEKLSDREYEVMRLIANGKSLTEISQMLSLSINTVSTYRFRVLEKMNLKKNYDVVRYALKHGIVDEV